MIIKPIKEDKGAIMRLVAMVVQNRWMFNDVAKEDLYCEAAAAAKEEHDRLVGRIKELEHLHGVEHHEEIQDPLT